MNTKLYVTMMTVALVAILAVTAVVSSLAQPTQAKTDQCHFTSGSSGCNPGSATIPELVSGFNCNNNRGCHPLPNN